MSLLPAKMFSAAAVRASSGRSVVLALALAVLWLAVSSSSAAVISNLTVYSDSACSTPWTDDGSDSSTWSVFSSLSDSQVDSSLLGTPGDCLGAISPTVQSARVACVTSYSTANATLYTLSAVEWSHNNSCPTSSPFDVRYYFYGRANSCIRSARTRHTVTHTTRHATSALSRLLPPCMPAAVAAHSAVRVDRLTAAHACRSSAKLCCVCVCVCVYVTAVW